MKPSVPKGVRDFLPEEIYKRNYIFDVIKEVFRSYGFVPIETPTMENLSTLTGKYGDEGDKLLFKVLNNGDFLSKADVTALEDRDSSKLTSSISKRGLRYDLTVPFARYVVQHQQELSLPFKRYQIQPVWRADRPQRGRYHEFYQCDVDVVGSDSLMYEAELVQIYDKVFSALGIEVEILVNNRKVLYGIAEALGIQESFAAMTTCIDKLDKIGEEKVVAEMVNKGIDESIASKVMECIKCKSLDEMQAFIQNSEIGHKGIEELSLFHKYFDHYVPKNKVTFDPSLARGLSYYTGCIFEVRALGVSIGSIGGGGRYDDLTSMFGLNGVSGVGVSFGFERIYVVMDELNLFPETVSERPEVLLVALDDESHLVAFELGTTMRSKGILTDVYPSPAKLKKQLGYANKKGIDKVLIIGEEERLNKQCTYKQMQTGEQQVISHDDIFSLFNK